MNANFSTSDKRTEGTTQRQKGPKSEEGWKKVM
jgi:hypothetical protein